MEKNMRLLLVLGLSLFASASFAGITKCEQKMQDLMLASERINYPESAQPELSKFRFSEQGSQVTGVGTIYVYNGDTIYTATGHRLVYGDPKDCVILKLDVEVLP
jgi:hypothetical protein